MLPEQNLLCPLLVWRRYSLQETRRHYMASKPRAWPRTRQNLDQVALKCPFVTTLAVAPSRLPFKRVRMLHQRRCTSDERENKISAIKICKPGYPKRTLIPLGYIDHKCPAPTPTRSNSFQKMGFALSRAYLFLLPTPSSSSTPDDVTVFSPPAAAASSNT